MSDYAFGFNVSQSAPPKKAHRKAKQATAPVVTPQPVQGGHWEQNPLTGAWVFVKSQQPQPLVKPPIVVHFPVKPGMVPAPNMKPVPVQQVRPVKVTRQHFTRRGTGITRRSDR
jgi:hypothetical protein